MLRKLRKNRGGASANKRKGKKRAISILRASVNSANANSDLLRNLANLKLYKAGVTGNSFNISCVQYSECSQDLFSWMMNLLEQNMAELYAACEWGWDLEEKRKEMSNKASRFIVAYSDLDKPVAFTHFRFDMDHNVSVVYCYELQVDPVAQKQGLAKHIMQILESLCHQQNMCKVILTVFKNNENACNFFASQGYKLDASSPQNFGIEAFYSILSKAKHDCFTS